MSLGRESGGTGTDGRTGARIRVRFPGGAAPQPGQESAASPWALGRGAPRGHARGRGGGVSAGRAARTARGRVRRGGVSGGRAGGGAGQGARRSSVLCWNVRLPRARGAAADRAPPRPRAPDRGGGDRCDSKARAGGLIPLRDRTAGLAGLGAQLFPALPPLPRESPATKKRSWSGGGAAAAAAAAAGTRGRRSSVGAQASG